ncbi:hypothetical protein HPB49_016718 [Dermacentor silvarum]|uniref:Uncharacterized protein n=1 Tax=Dermacentor silvarum TaxID=543639 RepID=A0ACB8D6N7_DERSI|nr:hypothetical protein HPB49_016718 [Dermacentor silvarum]
METYEVEHSKEEADKDGGKSATSAISKRPREGSEDIGNSDEASAEAEQRTDKQRVSPMCDAKEDASTSPQTARPLFVGRRETTKVPVTPPEQEPRGPEERKSPGTSEPGDEVKQSAKKKKHPDMVDNVDKEASSTDTTCSDEAYAEEMEVAGVSGSVVKRTRDQTDREDGDLGDPTSEEPPAKSVVTRRPTFRPKPIIPPDRQPAATKLKLDVNTCLRRRTGGEPRTMATKSRKVVCYASKTDVKEANHEAVPTNAWKGVFPDNTTPQTSEVSLTGEMQEKDKGKVVEAELAVEAQADAQVMEVESGASAKRPRDEAGNEVVKPSASGGDEPPTKTVMMAGLQTGRQPSFKPKPPSLLTGKWRELCPRSEGQRIAQPNCPGQHVDEAVDTEQQEQVEGTVAMPNREEESPPDPGAASTPPEHEDMDTHTGLANLQAGKRPRDQTNSLATTAGQQRRRRATAQSARYEETNLEAAAEHYGRSTAGG